MSETEKKPKSNAKNRQAVKKMRELFKDCFFREQDPYTKKFETRGDLVKLEQWKQSANALLVQLQDEGDKDSLVEAMRFMLGRKQLPVQWEYLLNELEAKLCNQKCQCIDPNTPPGIPAKLSGVYPFKSQYDEDKQRNINITYINREIPGSEQIDEELAREMANGFKPDKDQYKPTKTLWRKVVLNEQQWLKHFKELGQGDASAFF